MRLEGSLHRLKELRSDWAQECLIIAFLLWLRLDSLPIKLVWLVAFVAGVMHLTYVGSDQVGLWSLAQQLQLA